MSDRGKIVFGCVSILIIVTCFINNLIASLIFSDSSRRSSSSSKSYNSAPINTPRPRELSKNRSHSNTPKSRDSSPRVINNEEIPLENLNSSPSSRCSSNSASRSHTPSRIKTLDSSVSGPVLIRETLPSSSSENADNSTSNSEETSFIASEKRKGIIETV